MNASESSSVFADEKAPPPSPADRDALKAKMEARQKAAADAAAAKKLARATASKEPDTPQKARAPAKRHPAATPLVQAESVLPDPEIQMAQAEAQLQQHLSHVFVQGQVDGFRIGVFFGAGALLALGAAYYGYKYMYPAAEAISAAQ